jgi:hypothetical protein
MRRVKWKVLAGWSVKGPEKSIGENALKICMPYGLPECVLLPGDDTLIPTGLWFPGLYRDFIIIPIHHTYPNKGSDVMEVWNGNIKTDFPILHMSICVDRSQVFIHIINLGKSELKYRPGNVIGYFCFSPLIEVGDDGWEEGEEDLAGYNV